MTGLMMPLTSPTTTGRTGAAAGCAATPAGASHTLDSSTSMTNASSDPAPRGFTRELRRGAAGSGHRSRRSTGSWRRRRSVSLTCSSCAHERLEKLDRHREDDRAVLFSSNLGQRLQVAQLECRRLAPDHLRRVGELLRSSELTFGVNESTGAARRRAPRRWSPSHPRRRSAGL